MHRFLITVVGVCLMQYLATVQPEVESDQSSDESRSLSEDEQKKREPRGMGRTPFARFAVPCHRSPGHDMHVTLRAC